MFNRKILFLSLLVVGILFTGCPKETKNADYEPIPLPVVSFNMSGAEALGGDGELGEP